MLILLAVPLQACSAEHDEAPSSPPSSPVASVAVSTEPPVTPPPAVPGELARYEFDGAFTTSSHGGKKPEAGIGYGVKAACVGAGNATFNVSGDGAARIVEFTFPCDGVAILNGLGTLPPGSSIQVDAVDVQEVSSAWAVVAPLDALH
ncbi:hypothetical protein GCM10010112_70130 [Actinoplanes lobatus]|nr:hypothetical protein GCM10010112_70130 [Actinoplanes lobatus]GIE39617.1 hypothetical protein Alo02nite_25150 [Actinoplanes lobatus]